MIIPKKNQLTIFPCATCNLKCSYCSIDKNPSLQEIDKMLEESFQGDYYFNQIKKYYPNRGQLEVIETWGGEPFLKMERIFPLLHKIIDYYPYFTHFFSSTNFSFPGWNDKIFSLIEQFSQYPDRDFCVSIQLSCDGPEYINDLGRGKGTTKKCLNNFNIFVERLKTELPDNITLEILFKPTLDLINLKKLDTKEAIIEYYLFFEDNFIRPLASLNNPNIRMNKGVPNIAVPSPATKEDGIFFANFCKMTREIEKDYLKYFEFYKNITMFNDQSKENAVTMQSCGCYCGVSRDWMALLPDNKFATCSEGFTDISNEYKYYAEKSERINTGTIVFDDHIEQRRPRYCLTENQWNDFEKQIKYYDINGTTSNLNFLSTTIVILAMCGQIDYKYVNQYEAIKVANIFQNRQPFCIKNNYNVTGSITLQDYGMLKLFLNGAIDYINNEGEE